MKGKPRLLESEIGGARANQSYSEQGHQHRSLDEDEHTPTPECLQNERTLRKDAVPITIGLET